MPGGLMRAAATASMVSSARLNREQRKAVANYNQQAAQQAPAPATQQVSSPAPQVAAPVDDTTAQLKQLADLHAQGILTDEEFAAKKKQLLGI